MAKAYECDVCGTLFKRKGASDAAVVVYYHGYGEERKDLCPKCQKELETWLKGKESRKV
jgi:rubredoxin